MVDEAPLAQGQAHRYCVRASGGPLRLALVWHDFPGDPNAPQALVNNLDLQVRRLGRLGWLMRLGWVGWFGARLGRAWPRVALAVLVQPGL